MSIFIGNMSLHENKFCSSYIKLYLFPIVSELDEVFPTIFFSFGSLVVCFCVFVVCFIFNFFWLCNLCLYVVLFLYIAKWILNLQINNQEIKLNAMICYCIKNNIQYYCIKNNIQYYSYVYTNPPSVNHFKHQPKSASSISFYHNSIFVICYSVQ